MAARRLHKRPGLTLAPAAALALALALAVAGSGTVVPVSGRTRASGGIRASARPPASTAAASGARARASASGATGLCTSTAYPSLAAEISARIVRVLRGRRSVVGIAADDPAAGISCQFHPRREFHSASVVKVIILCTLLRELQLSHQRLAPAQAALAQEMITESDDDAATALWDDVGMANLQSFLTAAAMSRTRLGQDGYWGLTEVNAQDELLLLRLLLTKNTVLDSASRSYALGLMADVIPSQRWGVPAGAPSDVTVYLKNGWLPDPVLWVINSIGDFAGPGGDYSVAILTRDNPTMPYGVHTVETIARAINRGLAAAAHGTGGRAPGAGRPGSPGSPGRTRLASAEVQATPVEGGQSDASRRGPFCDGLRLPVRMGTEHANALAAPT
jgi:beta-lactamase class A